MINVFVMSLVFVIGEVSELSNSVDQSTTSTASSVTEPMLFFIDANTGVT